jgi:hypothetical protein
VTLPPSDEPTRSVQPGEEAFDDPASLVASKGAAVLGRWAHAIVPLGAIRSMPNFFARCASSGSLSYALSPINRGG